MSSKSNSSIITSKSKDSSSTGSSNANAFHSSRITLTRIVATLLLLHHGCVVDLEAALVNDAGHFATYLCDNEANVTSHLDRHCDVTIVREMLVRPLLFRSYSRPDRIKCLDCDIGPLRAQATLSFSMAVHTVDLSGSHVEHVEAGAVAGTMQTLLLSYNTLTRLDDVKLFAQTAQLRSLHLDHNELFYVDDRALDGLPELRELWLNHNRIVSLVARHFEHVPQLEKLRLHSNRLRTLDGDLFAANPRLRELTLYDNQLVHVDDDMWTIIQRIGSFDIANVQMQLDLNAADMAALANGNVNAAEAERTSVGANEVTGEDKVDCRIGSRRKDIPLHQLFNASCGNLSTVPLAAELYAKRYRYLNMRYNLINDLDHDAFAPPSTTLAKSHLIAIDLTHNQIESVHPNTFDSVPGLEELLLSHNYIRYLGTRLFSKLTRLRVLELHNNRVHTINAQQFWHTARLERLTLQRNRIKSVGDKAFDQLQQLDFFDMSDNAVQNDVLVYLNAKHVRIDRCNVAYMLVGDRCVRLHAFRNRLRSLNLRHAFALQHLNVSENHIDAVDLEATQQLQTVDLAGNQLTHIDFTPCNRLVTVRLADNFLVDARFATSATHLQSIDLSANSLTVLALPTETMYNLRQLNVSKNQLSTLQSLQLLYGLHELDVSDNPVSDIELSTFQNMDALETLLLRNLNVGRLEAGIFRALSALRVLDVSGNNITLSDLDVLATFNGLTALESLRLNDMQLQRVDKDAVLRTMPKLRSIGVSGNRWQCDELREFVHGMTAAYVEVESEWENVVEASVHGVRCAVRQWHSEPDAEEDSEPEDGTATNELQTVEEHNNGTIVSELTSVAAATLQRRGHWIGWSSLVCSALVLIGASACNGEL